MSKHIAFLEAAAVVLAASVLPAAAADYYDGGDDRPLVFHGRDDGYRRAPGPVVFDERGPDRRFDAYAHDDPGYRRPVPVERFGDDRPLGIVPQVERPYGGFGYGGGYRPAAVAVGPAYGGGYGGPDEGCTVERARSITPAGWEKTVTHRTCYRR